MKKNDLKTARRLLEFIDQSPTPFHAVDQLSRLLETGGFRPLREEDPWELKPGGRHYVTRNGSSLLAFVVGTRPVSEAGFAIIGAHTDSPNLRLKPQPAFSRYGYLQLGVEVYGGALLSTWTDRDLSLAGRVVVRSKTGEPVTRLVRWDQPLLRIPQLAIHLNRTVNEKGLVLNEQNHLPPIFQTAAGGTPPEQRFAEWLGRELRVRPQDLLAQDLMLYDVQPSSLGGCEGEFLFAPRLDNLASCHAATLGLLASAKSTPATRVLVFYDHEEVGSETAQGGGSPFLKDALERLSLGEDRSREAFMRALARSLFISADMAHGVHPNYADRHDAAHLPQLNAGPVIKTHAGQRYATDAESAARFDLLCQRAGVGVQRFAMRSDLRCGSTIGPITAANLGIKTVDVGNPMLSMHSAREMAGTADHAALIRVFREFFKS